MSTLKPNIYGYDVATRFGTVADRAFAFGAAVPEAETVFRMYLRRRGKSCIRAGLKSHATDISGFGRFFLLYTLLEPGAAALASPAHCLVKDNIMPIGTVKFFNQDKGYGFIQPEGSGNDAFVHISAVERAGMTTLNKDQRVSYDLEQDQRGKTSAVNLQSA